MSCPYLPDVEHVKVPLVAAAANIAGSCIARPGAQHAVDHGNPPRIERIERIGHGHGHGLPVFI